MLACSSNNMAKDQEVVGYEIAQTSYENMNMANKQGQEFELQVTCNSTCSSLSSEDDVRHVDHDYDLDDEINKSLYDYLGVEDEAQRLLKEIKIATEHVKESKFHAYLTEQIKGDAFQSQLKKVLGSYSQLNMVVYALGGLEFGFTSIFQLAIALILKQDFSSWIRGIEVYDPVFSPADVIVLKELGCEVLSVNERCRRQVEKPTLFYMPHAESHLVGDLLWANWCPSRMNQLILLDVSFKSERGKYVSTKFCGISEDYIYAIHDHTMEILIEEAYGSFIFDNFAFHFFEVDSQLDMETLIPDANGELSKKRLQRQREIDCLHMEGPDEFLWQHKCSEKFFMEPFTKDAPEEGWVYINGEYRGPRKYRCSWSPPPREWIKLNFAGRRSFNGDNHAGFGGICHNESKEPILIYKGALGKVNKTMATVEALRFGLTELLKIPNVTRNLIVEGDDLMVIQWANKRQMEHPEEIHESLVRVLSMLEEFNSVVYHIYEEANWVANNLAK